MTVFEAARTHMIESQLRPNKVRDVRVLAAFGAIRRELFVSDHLWPVAYIDEDLPLGANRFLMDPTIAARLLQTAAIEVKDTVLMVGAGTGYEAALAARLARSAVALEEDPDLARSRGPGPRRRRGGGRRAAGRPGGGAAPGGLTQAVPARRRKRDDGTWWSRQVILGAG